MWNKNIWKTKIKSKKTHYTKIYPKNSSSSNILQLSSNLVTQNLVNSFIIFKPTLIILLNKQSLYINRIGIIETVNLLYLTSLKYLNVKSKTKTFKPSVSLKLIKLL